MPHTHMGPEEKRWMAWLDGNGFSCGGKRRNVVARVLAKNKIKNVQHMKMSGPIDAWLGYDRLQLLEVVFLTEQMAAVDQAGPHMRSIRGVIVPLQVPTKKRQLSPSPAAPATPLSLIHI